MRPIMLDMCVKCCEKIADEAPCSNFNHYGQQIVRLAMHCRMLADPPTHRPRCKLGWGLSFNHAQLLMKVRFQLHHCFYS
mmetsp:Transcript_44212/g.99868  ORF Transcript_44212/g.99868 Transcript_44212/m.99868 type:complete len:80 (-) Transcript_44212:299-538(-)